MCDVPPLRSLLSLVKQSMMLLKTTCSCLYRFTDINVEINESVDEKCVSLRFPGDQDTTTPLKSNQPPTCACDSDMKVKRVISAHVAISVNSISAHLSSSAIAELMCGCFKANLIRRKAPFSSDSYLHLYICRADRSGGAEDLGDR